MISESFVKAGVPKSAINGDPLASPFVQLLDDAALAEWGPISSLPSTLQLVSRINGFGLRASDAMTYYIDSSSESQRALFLRGVHNSSAAFEPFDALPSRDRSSISSEDAPLNGRYAAALDALYAKTLLPLIDSSGYVVSYLGSFAPAMDFGYSDVDTNVCCLHYPPADSFWVSSTHFSTSDCLYQAHGGAGEKQATPFPLQPVDTSAAGSEGNFTSYIQYYCQRDESGVGTDDSTRSSSSTWQMFLRYNCESDTCVDGRDEGERCMSISAEKAKLDGCKLVQQGTAVYYQRDGCDDGGVPTRNLFSDSECAGMPIKPYVIDGCYEVNNVVADETTWVSSYLRDHTIMLVIGVRSNHVGKSTFHNIYLPDMSLYNSADAGEANSFNERDLEGSAQFYGAEAPDDGDLFVASFGRACLLGGEDEELNKYCKIMSSFPNNSLVEILVRQYLDPNTMTGPNKDLLPLHRVIVLDKKKPS